MGEPLWRTACEGRPHTWNSQERQGGRIQGSRKHGAENSSERLSLSSHICTPRGRGEMSCICVKSEAIIRGLASGWRRNNCGIELQMENWIALPTHSRINILSNWEGQAELDFLFLMNMESQDSWTQIWLSSSKHRYCFTQNCNCHACVLRHVRLLVTLWTVAHQAPLPWDLPGKNTGVRCHPPPPRGSSRPRDQTLVSHISCIGRWVLYHQCQLGGL